MARVGRSERYLGLRLAAEEEKARAEAKTVFLFACVVLCRQEVYFEGRKFWET